jgi:hypothetical protein
VAIWPSAWKQIELLNGDLWTYLHMFFICKEHHRNPVKIANLCVLGDRKAEHLVAGEELNAK